MMREFIYTFDYETKSPIVDSALQVVMRRIWSDPIRENEVEEEKAMREALACYKLALEGGDAESDDEELRHIEITETKGKRGVKGLELESLDITQPLQLTKVNIGFED